MSRCKACDASFTEAELKIGDDLCMICLSWIELAEEEEIDEEIEELFRLSDELDKEFDIEFEWDEEDTDDETK